MKSRKAIPLLATGCLLCLLAHPARAESNSEDAFFLKDGQTVLFVGDSITRAGLHVAYVDAFLFTRFPDRRITVLNRGISSETVAGTSEPNHPGPRPNLHDRFTRVVPPLQPDVVVAMYGMNDGIYLSFNEPVFAKYRAGIDRLIRRVRQEASADIVLMTPPVYDVARRAATNPETFHSWKYPADDYDRTLAQFSAWLVTKRSQGLVVADVHTTTADLLAQRRRDNPTFFFANDGIHPNPTGHWLIAQTLLLAWNAPAVCAEAAIDATAMKVLAGTVDDLKRIDGEIRFTWTAHLPMPVDARWDRKSIEHARTTQKLNRCRLTVVNAPAENYDLLADDVRIARVTRTDLAAGLDLLRFPHFPTVEPGPHILELVQQRQRILYDRWAKNKTNTKRLDAAQKSQAQTDKLEQQIRKLCRPKKIAVRLVPAPR